MILGECEQRAVYKRYNAVGNGPESVFELPVRFTVLISKYNRVFNGRDKPYFVCTHSASVYDRHSKHTYLVQGTPWWRR